MRGLKGICLLGATTGFGAERGVALSIYKILMHILEGNTNKQVDTKEKQEQTHDIKDEKRTQESVKRLL
jgi:proteasome assembly chaperone (PAC2) family protein